jgi:hypothetical protein
VLALILGLALCVVTPVMAQATNSLVMLISVSPTTTTSTGTLYYTVTLINMPVPGANDVVVDIYFHPPGPTGAAGVGNYSPRVKLDDDKRINVGQSFTYNWNGAGGALNNSALAVNLTAIPLNSGVTVVYAASEFDGYYIHTPVYVAYNIRNVPAGITQLQPNTLTTITASATEVVSGGSVTLNVTEQNTGSDNLTSPRVEIRKNGTLIHTLVAPPSSGDNGNGVLNMGETWRWNNIPSGAITGASTFVALGFGTDSLGHEISYAAGYLSERATVNVNTISPNTVTTIAANATTVPINGKVSLTVTEWNNGGDNLTKPRVEVRQNGTLIATLNKTSAYYASGDTNGNGILDATETWRWNNILSKAINATTTFEAKGFGTDSQGHEVSYAAGYLDERAVVIVNTRTVGWETYPIDKVRVLLPWIALLAAIMVGASLLVLRHRRAHN